MIPRRLLLPLLATLSLAAQAPTEAPRPVAERLEAEALRKLADVRLALEGGAGAVAQLTGGPKSAAEKQAIIERALARVRARRAGEPAGKP